MCTRCTDTARAAVFCERPRGTFRRDRGGGAAGHVPCRRGYLDANQLRRQNRCRVSFSGPKLRSRVSVTCLHRSRVHKELRLCARATVTSAVTKRPVTLRSRCRQGVLLLKKAQPLKGALMRSKLGGQLHGMANSGRIGIRRPGAFLTCLSNDVLRLAEQVPWETAGRLPPPRSRTGNLLPLTRGRRRTASSKTRAMGPPRRTAVFSWCCTVSCAAPTSRQMAATMCASSLRHTLGPLHVPRMVYRLKLTCGWYVTPTCQS